ncbi:MAG: hypothetical protein PVG49_05065 [Desulfobacteraceae bacterium]|jgi:hypothetical protein
MGFLENVLNWIATNFTADAYLVSTKVQGLLWSAADVVLVLVLLRIADLLRRRASAPPIRWRYLLLGVTVLLTPLLAWASSPARFLLLESVICGIQFLLLVYTLIAERGRFVALVSDLGFESRMNGRVVHK